jgi:hypothetical protein
MSRRFELFTGLIPQLKFENSFVSLSTSNMSKPVLYSLCVMYSSLVMRSSPSASIASKENLVRKSSLNSSVVMNPSPLVSNRSHPASHSTQLSLSSLSLFLFLHLLQILTYEGRCKCQQTYFLPKCFFLQCLFPSSKISYLPLVLRLFMPFLSCLL